jgi:hypothetical protein
VVEKGCDKKEHGDGGNFLIYPRLAILELVTAWHQLVVILLSSSSD